MAFEEFLVACAVEMLKSLILFAVKEVRMASDMEKELKRLQRTVMIIQEVLEEAEKQQMGKDLLKNWLKDLKDVVYEAGNILDEFSYQIMRSQEMSFRKRDRLRLTFSRSNPLLFHPNMAHAIKNINDKMDGIAKDRVLLDLLTGHSLRLNSFNEQNRDYHETTSFIEEKKVIGRQRDKENIIDWLSTESSSSSSSSAVSVIPIVGMAGLGKTTLAKLIFNAEVISDIFELQIWVHVSTEFNVKKILRHIIASVTESAYDRDTNMDVLERIMKEKLRGKKFLLVLDDLWNVKVDQWNKLTNQLNIGEHGSKIIVTTRSNEVADVVQGSANSTYTLRGLSENGCWSIIRQRAFAPGGSEETQNLVAICKDMARKCGGVPLAAKDIGDLLHCTRNEAGWSYIRDSTNWGLLEKNEMLPALRFSYIHLPSPLKQCFTYCSLFPKNTTIEKQILVQLWMAEAYLHPSDRNPHKELEDIGSDYFNSLLKNSLLHGEGSYDHNGDTVFCKLHHLVHDLAQDIVGSNECSILKASQVVEDTSELRRLRLILEEGNVASAEQLQNASKLQTLFIHNNGGDNNFNYQKLLKNKQFRVLDMQGTSIKGLPASIENMKHLRYLDLSRTEIEELPKFICGLYNLQTLLLRYCVKLRKFPETMVTLKRMRYLDICGLQLEELPDCITHLSNLQTLKLENCCNVKKLPGNIKNMINLRHLFLNNTGSWSAKPREIGSLTCLQTLTQFKVGKCNSSGCSTIRELECLNLLEGELWISNLEDVTGSDDAQKANLKGKENIQSLIMEWSFRTHDASDGTVMKQLQPNRSLKKLKIVNYQDPEFPTWMMGTSISSALPNLVEIELRGCYVCQQLPGLGQLPSLRVLTIATMDVVLCLGDDFYGDHKACKPFQELVEFTLTDLPCLEKWCIAQPPFPFYPRLEKLSVERCLKLERRQDLNFFFPAIKEYKLDGVTLISRTTRKIVSMVPSRQT